LFGAPPDPAEEERKATQKQIEQWFRGRLQGIFGYASEPLPLLTGNTPACQAPVIHPQFPKSALWGDS
jgi:hypothetical protein